jgi:hypothetical protein
MPLNDNVNLLESVWTLLTASDVAAARVGATSPNDIHLIATAGTGAPSGLGGAVLLPAGQMLAADLTFADLFPGVAGANRLWAFSQVACTLSVSHA